MGMQLSGSLELTGSLTTSGAIVAQTLVVQTITSSITQMTGSNIFGSTLTNRQQFTGSVTVTGSLAVNTTGTELQVNANGVTLGNALTDIHNVTGSLRVTGSMAVGSGSFPQTFAVKISGSTYNGTNVWFQDASPTDGMSFGGNGLNSFKTINTYGGGLYLNNISQNGVVMYGQVGIGTAATISESNLVLGALGTAEGGQLTLQAGTSFVSASHLDNYQNEFRVLSGPNNGSNAERLSLNMHNGNLKVYGSSYLGTNIVTSNSSGATAGQYGNAVSAEFGGTSWAVNLATILPTYTFSGRGLSVQVQILGLSDSSNGSSVLAHAYRSIGGTWVVNTVNTATNGSTFVNSITASGTTITVNWNTTAFGCVNVNVINRG